MYEFNPGETTVLRTFKCALRTKMGKFYRASSFDKLRRGIEKRNSKICSKK